MNNNLKRLKKDLRSYAKRRKNIKYTNGLLLTFLLTGTLSFSDIEDINQDIDQQNKIINNTRSDIKKFFRRSKLENKKLLKKWTNEILLYDLMLIIEI